ncbi:MAG: hypothetical protein HUJ31_05190, partial [Pseudomonadales bacterium]|nr:hypothetical protein [Pseudomonadales bacterium]
LYAAPRLMGAGAQSLLALPKSESMRDLGELDISEVRRVGRDIRITARLVK